jgi:hypothetical protein
MPLPRTQSPTRVKITGSPSSDPIYRYALAILCHRLSIAIPGFGAGVHFSNTSV